MTVANKIDLSSSVSQYLLTNNGSEASIPDPPSQNNKESEDPIDYRENSSLNAIASSFYRQDPRTSTNVPSATVQVSSNDDTSNPAGNFEFFSRQIADTNYLAPQALDEKKSSEDNTPTREDNSANKMPKCPSPSVRKSIYEWSGSDDDIDDNSRSARRSSCSSDDDDDSGDARYPQNAPRKDKDMRISTIFLENDYSNGDIDLRLPFKPVMANYIPATEIDASITSHAPILYKVRFFLFFF